LRRAGEQAVGAALSAVQRAPDAGASSADPGAASGGVFGECKSGAAVGEETGRGGELMRLGDWILCVSMGLNVAAALAYAWQGYWQNVWYWLSVLSLNAALMGMK